MAVSDPESSADGSGQLASRPGAHRSRPGAILDDSSDTDDDHDLEGDDVRRQKRTKDGRFHFVVRSECGNQHAVWPGTNSSSPVPLSLTGSPTLALSDVSRHSYLKCRAELIRCTDVCWLPGV